MSLLLSLNRFHIVLVFPLLTLNKRMQAGEWEYCSSLQETLFMMFFLFSSNTYSKVQANSKVIWKFQRYNLIQEYSIRPALVPPLSFLVNCYDTIRLLMKWCRNKDSFSISADRKLSE